MNRIGPRLLVDKQNRAERSYLPPSKQRRLACYLYNANVVRTQAIPGPKYSCPSLTNIVRHHRNYLKNDLKHAPQGQSTNRSTRPAKHKRIVRPAKHRKRSLFNVVYRKRALVGHLHAQSLGIRYRGDAPGRSGVGATCATWRSWGGLKITLVFSGDQLLLSDGRACWDSAGTFPGSTCDTGWP